MGQPQVSYVLTNYTPLLNVKPTVFIFVGFADDVYVKKFTRQNTSISFKHVRETSF